MNGSSMFSWRKDLLRTIAVLVPLAAGGATIALSMATKSPPAPKAVSEISLPVRVITLEELMLVPRVLGYGAVSPAREWRAVARVEGEVSWTSEKLANGIVVEAGAELLRIDDSEIRLSLAQIDAQMASLDVKDETTRASLIISEEALALERADLKRLRDLANRSVISRTAVERGERLEVIARTAVVGHENQLALNEAERGVLKAQRDITERSLDYTLITAPYALRIGDVQAEAGQFVNRGQTLFSADGVDAVEISAQFPIGRLAPLVLGKDPQRKQRTPLDFEAVVRLRTPIRIIEWPASVDRVGEMIDPKTQSVAIVIRVDQPLALAKPGERPPLRRNMFVEVELRGAQEMALVIPAAAIRDGKVMVVSGDGRLDYRDVDIAFTMGSIAVVASGIEAGEKLVVSELAVPVHGMAVTAIEDEALKARIAAIARNEE